MSAGGNDETSRAEGLLARLLVDDEFVERLEASPAETLREAGFELDDEQLQLLETARAESVSRQAATPAAIPAVLIAARVGTSPAVRTVVASQAEVRVVTATAAVSANRQARADVDQDDPRQE